MGKNRTVTKRGTRTPRTRGAGKYTESSFWNMIRVALRDKSRYWPPIALCRRKARVKILEGKKWKYFYRCNKCRELFSIENIEVHHTLGVGKLSCAVDLPNFVERLFCEENLLECICKKCHKEITENGIR